MKHRWMMGIVLLALGCLVIGGASLEAAKTATPSKASKVSCKTCHAAGFATLVPKGHPPVQGNDLASCTVCHKPDLAGTVKKNTFSTRMHLAHLPPKGKVDCLVCHRWTPGKSFGLVGMKESWGAPTKEDMGLVKEIFTSWAGSNFTDHLHARAGVGCITCHGRDEALPKADATVENQRCLACHGPVDKLAAKTEPKDFKDRNPHRSHLGDIACTVCHKAHAASTVYCLGCHQNFKMTIPGAGKGK